MACNAEHTAGSMSRGAGWARWGDDGRPQQRPADQEGIRHARQSLWCAAGVQGKRMAWLPYEGMRGMTSQRWALPGGSAPGQPAACPHLLQAPLLQRRAEGAHHVLLPPVELVRKVQQRGLPKTTAASGRWQVGHGEQSTAGCAGCCSVTFCIARCPCCCRFCSPLLAAAATAVPLLLRRALHQRLQRPHRLQLLVHALRCCRQGSWVGHASAEQHGGGLSGGVGVRYVGMHVGGCRGSPARHGVHQARASKMCSRQQRPPAPAWPSACSCGASHTSLPTPANFQGSGPGAQRAYMPALLWAPPPKRAHRPHPPSHPPGLNRGRHTGVMASPE